LTSCLKSSRVQKAKKTDNHPVMIQCDKTPWPWCTSTSIEFNNLWSKSSIGCHPI
jgi:hypothetical protein